MTRTASSYRGIAWNKQMRKWLVHGIRKVGDKQESHFVASFGDERSAAKAFDMAMLYLNGLVSLDVRAEYQACCNRAAASTISAPAAMSAP
jgi:hypothetical protein